MADFSQLHRNFSAVQHFTLGKVLNQKKLKNVFKKIFPNFFFDTTLFLEKLLLLRKIFKKTVMPAIT